MYILTINTGSSSVKIDLFDYKTLTKIASTHIDRVKSYDRAFKQAIQNLNLDNLKDLKVVTHRVVHGGERYTDTMLITKNLEKALHKLSPLAPLHNPVNLKGIKAAKKIFHCPHFAVFDTAFHQTIPKKAHIYGLPMKYYRNDSVRKYGFHGISHKYMYNQALKELGKRKASGITCHIGNGVSVTAIQKGEVIDTSMGFTPLEGCIMGTRSGNIDPEILTYLKSRYGRLDTQKLIQEKSGLLGLSEFSSDMRDIYTKAKAGVKKAQLVLDVYNYSIAKYVGMYFAMLPELDFIAFSGGIGQNAKYVRKGILDNLPAIKRPKIIVIEANEAYQMALETKEKLES
jgi:acetate kinase